MGFSISDLSIKKKIHIITIIATLILAVILFNSYLTLADNEKSLREVSDVSYKVVQIATANKYLIVQLDEQFTQSVTFGDADLIDKARATTDSIAENLKNLANLDKEYTTNREQGLLNDYSDISIKIAQSMIDGTADFNKIQDDAKTKSDKYNDLVDSFKAIQDRSDKHFIELIEATKSRSHSSLITGVVITLVSLAVIVFISFFVATAISASASEVASSLRKLADGEGSLSSSIPVRGKDEIGKVSYNFNAFILMLKQTVENVVAVSGPLTQSSNQLVHEMESAEEATNKQAQDAEVVRQSMEEMKYSVSDISASAASAASAAAEAEKEVDTSLQQITNSVRESSMLSNEIDAASVTINKLASDTQNVEKILNVITSIAEQTNLLALNAAIEAARAGEQGRGFAVVADEVRELASRTASSTNEIRELINALTAAASESVSAMTKAMDMARNNAASAESTGHSIEKISEQILSINTMNAQIAAATEEQTSVASTVVDNVSNMHESFQLTLQTLNEVRQVASSLQSLSDNLTRATSQFKLN